MSGAEHLSAWRRAKLMKRTDGTLHIYAQDIWHFPAGIAGSREALTALRDALDEALRDGWSCLDAFTNDGEGYSTYIAVADEATEPKLRLPYTDECAWDHREDAVDPEDIIEAALAQTEEAL